MPKFVIAVASGAGISAESGVPTFRTSGEGARALWQGRRPEDVATPHAFNRDPVDVWEFYFARRRDLLAVQPNRAHVAIASWQERFGDIPVITQNIDGLHQAAGSRNVLELHGSIWARRCSRCAAVEPDRSIELMEGRVPVCKCGGLMRPNVVWFGEALPEKIVAEAFEIVRTVKYLIVVGTSNLVYPAASLPLEALAAGARVIEVNPQPTPLSKRVTRFIQGRAGDILPGLIEELEW